MYCEKCETDLTDWETTYEHDWDEGFMRGYIEHDLCPDCGTELYY